MNNVNKLKILLLLPILCGSNNSLAQTFEKVSVNISFNNYFGYLVLADLNNDGAPEIIQTGLDGFNIFKNTNGYFDAPTAYPTFKGESQTLVHTLDVGDINRDGWIDILQSGGPNNRIFHILINDHPGFTNIAGDQINGLAGASFLGDFEGDGDLDIIYSGADRWSNNLGGIMINRNNASFESGPAFTRHFTKFATWWELDQDSQLEVVQSVGGSNYFIGNYILENGFPSMQVDKTLSISPSIDHISFADYDSDGDFDMLVKLNPNRIYNNVNGNFIDSGITFPNSKTAEFADINNDGLFDVVIGGMMTTTWQVFETSIYLNQGNGMFTKLDTQIPANDNNCSARVADIDDDGDLDIVTLNGVYKNNSAVTNARPTAPDASGSGVSGSSVKLTWEAASDDHTPQQSLTYNIAVHSEEGMIVVPSHSLPSGKRQIYETGNAYNNLSFNLSCLKKGTYYWKVQSLDASFQGSEFSPEQSFTIIADPPVAPINLTAHTISDASIELNWLDQSSTEDFFIIYRKELNSQFDFIPLDSVPANQTHYTDTVHLQPETTYVYQIVASNCAYPYEFMTENLATTYSPVFVNSDWLDLGETEGSLAELGDYDNDGDLDLLLSYSKSNTTQLFRFEGNAYVNSGISFPVKASVARWIDYNNDSYIDLILDNGKIYKNETGVSFSEVMDSIFPLSIQWQAGQSLGDYDSDGDEDLIIQAGEVIHIYDNDGKGKFSRNFNINLSGYLKSSGAWADYDLDGDLDILANKQVSCNFFIVVVFENLSGNTFVPVEFVDIQGTNSDFWNYTGDMEWGDYDNDGYPDIIVAGQTTCGNGYGINNIYRNNKNKTFTQVSSLVRLIYDVNVDWGDYDNDGDLDVFAFGDPFGGNSMRSRIYRNEGNRFRETNISYLQQSTQHGKTARGDIDNDGDLDYVILGELNYVNPRIIVYKNQIAEGWGKPNQAPSAPTSLVSEVVDQSVTLSWMASHDNETAQEGLTYNIYILDEADSIIVNSYSLDNGTRKIAAAGNVKSGLDVKLVNLKAGTYRWAVQSIDKGLKGSKFSEQGTFVIEMVTSIQKEKDVVDFFLSPNPTTRYVKVTVSETKNEQQIVILNSLGQEVLSKQIHQPETDLDISALPAGLYIVSIFSAKNKIGLQKLIKR